LDIENQWGIPSLARNTADQHEAEQALRTSVVYGKVTDGFRSEWGVKTYTTIQSVIATA
jgi:hypothetical protein